MTDPSKSPNGQWTPRIVAFFCNWCTYTAADLAGVSRLKYAANVRVIRLMCSGRVDPVFIPKALLAGYAEFRSLPQEQERQDDQDQGQPERGPERHDAAPARACKGL